MSKLRKSIILLVAFMFIASTTLYFYKTNQVKNVFDEIYFAEFKSIFGGYTETSFVGNDYLDSMSRSDYNQTLNSYGSIDQYYLPEKLNKEEILNIRFTPKEFQVEMYLSTNLDSSTSLLVEYQYNAKKKALSLSRVTVYVNTKTTTLTFSEEDEIIEILSSHGLSEDYIKERSQHMLEKVLQDWFDLNGDKSNYSIEDWGEITHVPHHWNYLNEG